MAQITLTIEAVDAVDLQDTLTQLGRMAGAQSVSVRGHTIEEALSNATETPEQGDESPQQPAARRGRPKKDQTSGSPAATDVGAASSDAGNAAQSATPQPDTSASAPLASAASPAPAASSPSPSATAGSSEPAAVISKDQLVDVMSKAMETIDPAKIQAHLETKLGAGMKSASTIPAERYGDAIAAIEGLLALS